MKFVLIMLAGAGIALLLPVLIPAAALLSWLDARRMRRAARRAQCERCGQTLGDEAIERGEAAWRDRMAELHWRPELGIRRRVVRDLHAVCPSCGAAYRFIGESRRFAPVAEPAPGAHTAS